MVFLDIHRTLVSNEQVKKGCKLAKTAVFVIYSLWLLSNSWRAGFSFNFLARFSFFVYGA